jgi:hypothetical protein
MADIGILNEGALHAALKQDYLGDNGRAEVPLVASLPMWCAMV